MSITPEKAGSLHEEFFGDDPRERAVLKSLQGLLPGHRRFIDLGANIGQYSYVANKHLKNAEIVCIEANPDLVKLLEDTIARARRQDDHGNSFRVVNAIVSDVKARLPFYVQPDLTTSSIFPPSPKTQREENPQSGSVQYVNSIALDDLHDPANGTLIKMDIEGAEYRALRSGEKVLASNDTTFVIEVHPWGDSELKRYPLHLATLMLASRYRMKKLVPHYWFGSHYSFTKAGFARSLGSYIYYLPVLLAEFVVYRFGTGRGEQITGFLRRFLKRG